MNRRFGHGPGKTVFRVVAFHFPIAASIALLLLFIYYWDRFHERALHEAEAEQSVRLQAEIINSEFKSIGSDLLYLANQDTLKTFLSERTSEQRIRVEKDYLLFSSRKNLYDQIRFLNSLGTEVIRINYNSGQPAVVPLDQLQDKRERYYFKDAIGFNRDEIYLSPFDLNIEHGELEIPFRPVVRIATPVLDRAGSKAGVLVFNYLAQVLIQKTKEVSSAVSGSAMLLNDKGFWLLGLKPEDEWGFVIGNNRVFGDDYREAWERISSDDQGQFITENGLFTFTKISFSPKRKQAENEDAGRANNLDFRHNAENAVTVVSLIPESVLYQHSNQLFEKLLLVYLAVILFFLVLILLLTRARVVRERDQHNLQESEKRLRILTRKLLSAQEDERRRISRELHDDLGQRVTAICLDLDRTIQRNPETARESGTLRALEEARGLLDSIKAYSFRLRPQILDDLGLRDAVQSHLSEFENRTGIATDAILDFSDQEVPHSISENIYRILQEALNNISIYASTERVFIRLIASSDKIELTIRDEGVGMDVTALDNSSLGILGMRERAELLGGTFTLSSEKDQGTEIKVSIPIQTAAQ